MAITSTAGPELRSEAVKLGAVEVVERPLEVAKVIDRLRDLTGQR